MEVLEEIITENPCQMPDYLMKGLAMGAKFFMRRFVMSKMQVADYFGVDERTIDRWRKTKDFPEPFDDGRRSVSFSVDTILEWKRKNKEFLDLYH